MIASVGRVAFALRCLAASCSLFSAAASCSTDVVHARARACSVAIKRSAGEAIAICSDAYDKAVSAQQSRVAAGTLVDRATASIALARYDDAAHDLDRAETLFAPFGDWRDAHRVERQRGILAYRRERLADAALHFGKALDAARVHGDDAALAQSWNDIGNAYRRVGDYAQALQAFTTSLALHEALGTPDQAAPVLNNLGNVQQDLGDYVAAEDWLLRSLAAYRTQDAPRQIAHVLESLALNDRELDRADASRARLVEAWDVFVAQSAPRDQLRVATHLARADALDGRAASAQQWIDRATSLADSLQQPATLPLLLAQARVEAASGRAGDARRALRERLRTDADAPVADRVEARRFLADTSERERDAAQAIADLKAAQAVVIEQAERTRNERVAQWQVRLDVATKLREIETLRAQNREQALRMDAERWRARLLLALALCVLVTVSAWLVLRLQRQRARAAAERVALEHRSERYRAAADALRMDRHRRQVLADRSSDALVLLDPPGVVLVANAPAKRILGDDVEGKPLAASVGDAAQPIVDAIAAVEVDGSATPIAFERGGHRIRATCGVLGDDVEEPLGWIRLTTDAAPDVAGEAPSAAPEPTEAFRRALVELMVASVQAWERSTGLARVEFAERSGIWRVHIDDGRLRMRSMERYLSLSRLPRHPRWREVLRSAYFVLAECPLDAAERTRIERLVDDVRAQITEQALG